MTEVVNGGKENIAVNPGTDSKDKEELEDGDLGPNPIYLERLKQSVRRFGHVERIGEDHGVKRVYLVRPSDH